MSYIVPGDIPKNCFACPCGYETEGAFRDECSVLKREYEKDADSVRPNWCPLVEVKEPHGDLTDKDKLMQEFMDSDLDYLPRDDWKEIIQIVSGADVVIKAEGRET